MKFRLLRTKVENQIGSIRFLFLGLILVKEYLGNF